MRLNPRLAVLGIAALCAGAIDASAQNHQSNRCGSPESAAAGQKDDSSGLPGVLLVASDQLTSPDLRLVLVGPERRVRLLGRRLQPLAAEGALRSPTFARLLLTLQQGRVIVHVQDTPQLPPSIPARLVMGRRIGGFRYLRVQLGSSRAGDDLIALLGHELFHALEIAQANVDDSAGLTDLYRRIGHRTDTAQQFDTDAARVVEYLIRKELSTRTC